MPVTTGLNQFGWTKWVVNPTAGLGTHTTIASAVSSASSGDLILIQPATYTENITLKSGVSFCAIPDRKGTQSNGVIVIGKFIDNAAACACSFYGMQLRGNSDNFMALTGASTITFSNCFLTASGATGLLCNNSSAIVKIIDCDLDQLVIGDSTFTITSASTFTCTNCSFQNNVNTTTQSSVAAGTSVFTNCQFLIGVSSSGTANMIFQGCMVGRSSSAVNLQTINVGSSGTNLITNCQVYSGTQVAINVSSTRTVSVFNTTVNSSNANALDGSGTINYSGLLFTGSSNNNNVTNKNPIAWKVDAGGTGVTTMTTAYSPVCAGTTAQGAFQAASTGLSTSGAVFTSNGASALPSFQTLSTLGAFTSLVGTQVFTGDGTYTPTSGMKYCIIECVGGGGGGAGCPLTGATAVAAGGGGGGGGYARKVFSAATIGASKAITMGTSGAGGTGNAAGSPGGTTTVGAILSATGGSGGGNAGAAGTTTVGGGAGGTGSSGDINIPGSGGGSSFGVFSTNSAISSGKGGDSFYGAGGAGIAGTASTSNNGNAGTGYGSGGSGAGSTESQSAKNGGAGASGIVIITEFC